MSKHTIDCDVNHITKLLGLNAPNEVRVRMNHMASLNSAGEGGLSFCTSRRKAEALSTKASAIIMTDDLADHYKGEAYIIRHPDPLAAFVMLMEKLISSGNQTLPTGVHPQAICAPSSSIAPSAHIGANVVIEANAVIEDNVQITAGCYVGENTVIKKNTRLNANVTVHHDCDIGENCIIHSGACIGVDGFGYVETKNGLKKIPHLGKVIIGNNVEIGANCCIDRGMLDNTEIHNGVKLDNLVHIAHNVILGENSAIAGQSGIAGSTTVGKNLRMGGQSGIGGQIKLTNNVIIGGDTAITNSIENPGFYIGVMPAQTQRNWARSAVAIRKLGVKKQEKEYGNK